MGREVEQQEIDEVVLVAFDAQPVLASDEGETRDEFGKGLGHTKRHGPFHGPLVGLLCQAKEVQHQRVLGDLPCHVRPLPRQARLEVVRRGPGRVWSLVRMWCSSTALDQPFSAALAAYQYRSSLSRNLSNRTVMCPHPNSATGLLRD